MISRRLWFTPIYVALLGACVDTTPIQVDETHEDAGVDSGTPAECVECFTGEGRGCRAAYDLCLSLPDCPEFHQCVLDHGCYGLALLEERLACGQPCLDLIHFTSTHPALPAVLAINECSQTDCRSVCIAE